MGPGNASLLQSFPGGQTYMWESLPNFVSILSRLCNFLAKTKTVRKELLAVTNEKPVLAGKRFTKNMLAFEDKATQANLHLHVALHFHHINRESCVWLFTGLPSPVIFEKIFSWIEIKEKHMQYWKGENIANTCSVHSSGELGSKIVVFHHDSKF